MPPKIYNAKNAKKAKKAKKPNLLQGASQRARPQRLILPPWPRQKKVGGGGPHWGFQSAGHRKCAIGVPDWSQIRYQIHPDLSQMANLKSQTLYARQRSYIPLSLSLPRSQGIIGARPKIFAFCVLLAHVGRFFRLPERA